MVHQILPGARSAQKPFFPVLVPSRINMAKRCKKRFLADCERNRMVAVRVQWATSEQNQPLSGFQAFSGSVLHDWGVDLGECLTSKAPLTTAALVLACPMPFLKEPLCTTEAQLEIPRAPIEMGQSSRPHPAAGGGNAIGSWVIWPWWACCLLRTASGRIWSISILGIWNCQGGIKRPPPLPRVQAPVGWPPGQSLCTNWPRPKWPNSSGPRRSWPNYQDPAHSTDPDRWPNWPRPKWPSSLNWPRPLTQLTQTQMTQLTQLTQTADPTDPDPNDPTHPDSDTADPTHPNWSSSWSNSSDPADPTDPDPLTPKPSGCFHPTSQRPLATLLAPGVTAPSASLRPLRSARTGGSTTGSEVLFAMKKEEFGPGEHRWT